MTAGGSALAPTGPAQHVSFREVLAASDTDHDAATALALGAPGAATGCSPRAAQRLLDGPVGAGLAAMVVRLCDEVDMALEAAVTEAVRRRQGWPFGHTAGQEHGVGHDMPYLSGRLAVIEREAPHAPAKDKWWLRAPHWLPPEMMGKAAWPEGLREAVGDVAQLAFRRGLEGVVGAAALDDIALSAVAAISRVCGMTLEGAVAFLADEDEGLALALALRSELALNPAAGGEAALRAALAVWKAVPLGRTGAARTGFSPGCRCYGARHGA